MGWLAALEELHAEAKAKQVRRLVVVETATIEESLAVEEKLATVLSLHGLPRTHKIIHPPALGQESAHLLLNHWQPVSPDEICLAAGTIRAGGLCIWLTPPLALWPNMDVAVDPKISSYGLTPPNSSHFIARIAKKLQTDPTVARLVLTTEQWQYQPLANPTAAAEKRSIGTPTPEQTQAIAAVQHVLSGHRKRPLVITASRGRGKSAALGLAAKAILQQTNKQIIVTSSSKSACTTLLQHAGNEHATNSTIRFVPFDILKKERPKASLLIIDEAASLSLPALQLLCNNYSRVAMATTTDGYEGTGQGFLIKFLPFLERDFPGWQHHQMHAPIRWAEHCPLEGFLNDCFVMVDADSRYSSPCGIKPQDDKLLYNTHPKIIQLDQNALASNPVLLEKLFYLLSTAHYQTKPSHLKFLLDAPGMVLFVAMIGDQVVGVLEAICEGNIEPELAQHVAHGKRRLQGNLAAQGISQMQLSPTASVWPSIRIHRISVAYPERRQGIGSKLLASLELHAKQQKLAYLSSCFSANIETHAFWQHNDYQLARIGLKTRANSGDHTITMVKPLSPEAKGAVIEWQNQSYQQLRCWLSGPLASLELELAYALLRANPIPGEPLNDKDMTLLQAFCNQHCQLEVILPSLQRLLGTPALHSQIYDDAKLAYLLIGLIYYRMNVSDVVQLLKLPGKKALAEALALSVQVIISKPQQS